jgi:hypothetical protein
LSALRCAVIHMDEESALRTTDVFVRLSLSGLTVDPRLSAHTFSATVIIKANASDSTNVRIAGVSFCKSCLATITK